MGCTNSKTQTTKDPAPVVTNEQAPPDELERAESFLRAVGPSYWAFIQRRCPAAAIVNAEWLSFVSTCDFLMNRELSSSRVQRRRALELLHRVCPHAPIVEPAKVVDESICALLEAWINNAEEGTSTVPAAKAKLILKQTKILRDVPADKESFSFADVVDCALQWTCSSELAALFYDVTDGAETMSAEQLAKFSSYGAEQAMSIAEAKEKIAKRLGGEVTLLRFLLYFGNPTTNDVLDPKKSLSVWQDMSQPLTRYSIMTRSVSTADEVIKALVMGTRAFVLRITSLRENEPMLSRDYTLTDCLKTLKTYAFKGNPLPVILCFMPDAAFTVQIQDMVADVLEACLGDSIAPGLMFRGSTINDAKFSPLGLQNRFLIMAEQGPLKPFVGFSVADMQRHGLGVRVTSVPEGTPAARAGIGKTDWLTHFNGEPIESKENLKLKLATLNLGEEFRVRKEGLTEVTGIVGASVTDDTDHVSKKFSALLFLNFMPKDDNAPRLPWDAAAESLPTAPESAASPAMRAGSPVHDNPDHFRFVSRTSVGGDDVDERERAVSAADTNGVQFIDTESSAAAARWARGKFADNGHCGYVLQRRPHSISSEASTTEFDHGRMHSEIIEETPASIHFEIQLLAAPHAQLASTSPIFKGTPESFPKGRNDLTCAVAVIGTPERRRAPLSAMAELDVGDPQAKILLLRTNGPDGSELEAALPAHLVRSGYRIVSFLNRSLEVYPILCAVKRKDYFHRASAHDVSEIAR